MFAEASMPVYIDYMEVFNKTFFPNTKKGNICWEYNPLFCQIILQKQYVVVEVSINMAEYASSCQFWTNYKRT